MITVAPIKCNLFSYLSRKFTISKTIGETHLYQTEEEESSGVEPPSPGKNPPAKNTPTNSDENKKEDGQPGLSNDVSSLLEDAPPTQSLSEDAPPTHSLSEEDAPPTHSPQETADGGRDSEETDVDHESRHHSSRYSEDEGEGETEEQREEQEREKEGEEQEREVEEEQEREGEEEQEREGEEDEQGNVSLRRIDAQEKVEDPQLLEALREIQNKILKKIGRV
jgi:hypothetical protein